MTRQAQFVLLNFLYLACPLAVVQADSTPYIASSSPFTLTCKNATNNSTLFWEHNGQRVDNTSGLFEIKNDEITILRINEDIYNTTFTCANGSKLPINSYKIFPKPMPAMEKNTVAVEGEKLTLHCGSKPNGQFYKDVIIQWRREGEVIGTGSNWTSRIRYEPDHEIIDAILVIEKPEMNDAGSWSCVAAYTKENLNDTGIEIAATTLRVKDKLAALWPFLGICAEVFILCAIILIYEKKRNKSELEESDTDQSPETKPTPNKDSDVRQRK